MSRGFESFFKRFLFVFLSSQLFGQTTITVNSNVDMPSDPTLAGTLRAAFTQINETGLAGSPYTIVFTEPLTITLQGPLPPLNFYSGGVVNSTVNFNTMTPQAIQVNGNGNAYPLFFIVDGNVTLQGMTLMGGLSQGGAGTSNGGGGLGAGGAIFVNEGTSVTLVDCTINGNKAVGGLGSQDANTAGGGGGGMLQGNGSVTAGIGGGGGGLAASASGQNGAGVNGGMAGSSMGSMGGNGGIGGGGGGGAFSENGVGGQGGTGGDFGGGGGGGFSSAGEGGSGGSGGWGGGGGGGCLSGAGGGSSFGGGSGGGLEGTVPGADGQGLGGGIFVRDGGSLTIENVSGSTSLSGNSATTAGGDLYLDTGVTALFQPASGLKFSLGSVAGPGSLTLNGAGTLSLTSSTSSVNTNVNAGTLELSSGSALTGSLNFTGNGSLQLNNTTLSPSSFNIGSNTVTIDSNGTTSTVSPNIQGSGTVIFESSTSPSTGLINLNGNYTGQNWQMELASGTVAISSNSSIPPQITFSGTSTLSLPSGIVSFFENIAFENDALGTLYSNGINYYASGVITGSGTLGFAFGPEGGLAYLSNSANYMQPWGLNIGSNIYGGVLIDNQAYIGTGLITFQNQGRLIMIGSAVLPNHLFFSNSAFITANTGLVLNGDISGSGTLYLNGMCPVTLNGTNSYGGTDLSTIDLIIGAAASLPNAPINFHQTSTLDLRGVGTLVPVSAINDDGQSNQILLGSGGISVGSGSFAGLISGAGELVKTGSLELSLSGANSYAGGTQINGGTLGIAQGGSLGSGTITFTGDSTLQLQSSFSSFTPPQIGINSSVVGTIDVEGNSVNLNPTNGVTGGGSLGLTNSSSSSAGSLLLSGTNSYGGSTVVTTAGLPMTVTVASSSALPTGGGLTLSAPSSGSVTFNAEVISDIAIGDLNGTTNTTLLLGTGGFSVTATGADTFNGVINGTGPFVMKGMGSLLLGGANQYTNGTQIQSGTLGITQAAALSSGSVTFTGNGTLQLRGVNGFNDLIEIAGSNLGTIDVYGTSSSISGNISGSGSLHFSNSAATSGTLTLSGTNNYTGSTTISTTGAGSVDVILASSGSFTSGSSLSLSSSGGTATLDASALSSSSSFSTGDLLGTANTLLLVGPGGLSVTPTTADLFSGVISGSGGLILSGSHSLALGGVNSYMGNTTINSPATLYITGSGSLNTTGVVSVGGTFDISSSSSSPSIGGLEGAGLVNLGSQTLGVNPSSNSTFSGVISGSGQLVKGGTGSLLLAGVNTYTGTTTITNGTLAMTGAGTLGSAFVEITGGTFDISGINGGSLSLPDLGGSGGTLNLGGKALTIGSDGLSPTYSGIISGPGGVLVKTGTGTLTLTNNSSSYSGGTEIEEGTLVITQPLSLGTGTVTLSNATLELSGVGNFSTPLSLNSGDTGTLSVGSTISSMSSSISGGGSLNVQGSGTLTLSGLLSFGGNLTVPSGLTAILKPPSLNSYGGTTTIQSGGTLQFGNSSAIPSTSAVAVGGILDLNGFSGAVSTISGSGTISLPNGSVLQIGATSNFSGVVTGAGGVTVAGSGTVTLSGTNSYGSSVVSGNGALVIQNTFGGNGPVNLLGAGGLFDISNIASSNIGDLNGVAMTTLKFGNSLTVATTGADRFQGVLSATGTGNLTVTGSGSLELTATNAIAAGLTIDSPAQLELQSTNTVTSLSGGGALSLGNTLTVNTAGGPSTFSGTISGVGGVAMEGSGVLTLSGTNSYTGGTTVAGSGTITLGTTGSLSSTGPVIMSGGGTLDASGVSSHLTIGDLSGSSGVVKIGGGVFTVTTSGADVYGGSFSGTGSLALSGSGSLQLNQANATPSTTALLLSSGTLIVNDVAEQFGLLSGSGGLSLNGGSALVTLNTTSESTFSGSLSGAGGLTLSGSAPFTLAGTNSSYSGITTINSNTLILSNGSSAGTGPIVFGGNSTLQLNGISLTNGISIASSVTGTIGGNGGVSTLSGVISGSGNLATGGSGTLILGSTNSYTGTTTIASGTTLELGAVNAIPSSATEVSGTLNLNGHSLTLPSLTGSGTTSSASGATLTLTNSGADTYSGVISGLIALTMGGTSTFTLPAANSLYTGGTMISNTGTLEFSGSGSLNLTGPLTFTAAGVLNTSSLTDVTVGDLNGSSGTVEMGSGVFTVTATGADVYGGSFSGTGSLALSGSGSLQLNQANATSTTTPLLISSGTLIVNDVAEHFGSLSGNGSLSLSGASAIVTLNNTGGSTFSGTVSGSGGFILNGSAPFTLSGVNSYSGTTTINNNTLILSNGSSAGTGPIVFGGNGTLQLNAITLSNGISIASSVTGTVSGNGGISTLSGLISGSGNLATGGSGTLILGSTNSYTGTTTIASGTTLELGAVNAIPSSATEVSGTLNLSGHSLTLPSLTGSGAIVSASGATLTMTNSGADTYGGVISGPIALTLEGSSTFILPAANSLYTGTTTISNTGTLQFSGSGPLNLPGPVTFTANGIFDASDLTNGTVGDLSGTTGTLKIGSGLFAITTSGADTFNGVVTGAGGLTLQGGGIMTLGGALSYGGATNVTAGAALLLNGTTLPTTTNGTINGTLNLNGNSANIVTLAGSGTVVVPSGTLTVNGSSTFSGTISGGGNLTKAGAGTTFNLVNINGYTGTTTISGGTLALLGSGSIAASGTVTVDGTLDLSNLGGFPATIQNFSGTGTVNLGTASLSIDQTASALTFSGIIQGSGGVSLTSGGTLTLSGNNTYTGTTRISLATLAVGGGVNLVSTSPYILSSTGTLDIHSATSVQIGDLTGAAGSTVALGSTPLTIYTTTTDTFNGTFTGTGNLTIGGTGTFQFGGTLPNSGIAVESSSTLAIGEANSIASLSGNGALSLGGTLTINNTSDFSGTISGVGGLIVAGGTLSLSGANSFVGGTTIDPMTTLALTGGGSLSASGAVTANGTLSLSGASVSEAIGDLSGASTGVVNLGGGALTINSSVGSTFAGVISGSGTLTKSGSATLTLTGANSITGTTTVSTGKLALSGGGTLGGVVAVESNGTFDLSGATGPTLTIGNLSGVSGATVTLGANTLSLGGNGLSETFGGVITGTGGLTKTGGGVFSLTNGNTYTGPTTVSGGTLALSGSGTILSSGTVTIDGTLDVSQAGSSPVTLNNFSGTGTVNLGANRLRVNETASNLTFSGTLEGTGGLTKAGSGTLTLSNLSYSGTTNIAAGTLAVAAVTLVSSSPFNLSSATSIFNITGATGVTIGDLVGVSGSQLIQGAAPLTLFTSTTDSFAGTFSGTGSLEIEGTGTLQLSASPALSSSSPLIVTSGTLSLSSPNTVPSLSGGSGGTLSLTGSAALTVNGSSTTSFPGSIVGSGGLTLEGSGTLTLAGQNTHYTGATTVGNSATLQFTGSLNLTGGVTLTGTSIFDGSGTTSANITDLNSSSSLSTVKVGPTFILNTTKIDTFDGVITGAGGLTIQGSGTMNLNGPLDFAGVLTTSGTETTALGGTNSYTGSTIVGGGSTLLVTSGGALPSTTVVTVNGLLNLGGTSPTVAGLGGSGTVSLPTGTFTVNNTSSTPFSGVITGGGSLTVGGSTALILSGINSYTGSTTINSGADLTLTGSGALFATGAITDNGTLNLSGVSAPFFSVGDLSGSGTVTFGATNLIVNSSLGSTFSGTLSGSGSLFKQGNGTLTLSGATTAANLFVATGTLAIGSSGTLNTGTVVLEANSLNNAILDISAVSSSVTLGNLTGAAGTKVNLGTKTLIITPTTSDVYSGVFSGSGTLTLSGSSTFQLNEANAIPSTAHLDVTSGTVLFNNISDAIGSLNGAGDVVLSGTSALTVTQGSFSGTLSGAGSFTVSAGTMTLSGSNVYTGGTTVNGGGTLILNSSLTGALNLTTGSTLDAHTLPSIAIGDLNGNGGTIKIGSSFTVNGTGVDTYGGIFTGAGDLSFLGSGSLKLGTSGAIPSTANVTVSNGTLSLATNSIGALSGTGTVSIGSSSTLTTNGSSTFNGILTGSGALVIASSSQLTLTAASAYTGGTTVEPGSELRLSGSGTLGNGGVVTDNGTIDLSATTSGVSMGALSGSGTVLLGTKNLTLTSSVSSNFGGSITGSGSLIKAGNGTLTLSGANTTGSTFIDEGTLALGTGGSLGTGQVTLAANTTFNTAAVSSETIGNLSGATGSVVEFGTGNSLILEPTVANLYSGIFSGSGTLTLNGAGSLQLNVANAIPSSANLNVTNGTLIFNGVSDAVGSISGGGTVVLSGSGAALTVSSGSFSGTLTGSGSLTMGGGGTLTLSGTNSYTGGTIVNGGGTLTIDTSLVPTGSLTLDANSTFNSSSFASTTIGDLNGNSGTIKIGSGTFTVNATQIDSYSGVFTGSGNLSFLGRGSLTLGAMGAIPATANVTVSNGTLGLNGNSFLSLSGNGAVVLNGPLVLTNSPTIFSGKISGNGNLTLSSSTFTLQGANTYGGGTTINSGATLVLSESGSLSSTGAVVVGGALDLSSAVAPFNLLGIGDLSGSGTVHLGGNSLIVDSVNGSTFNGVITGSGALIKTGPGTLILTAPNTYSAGTAISEGTLSLMGLGMLNSSSSLVADGTFDISGATAALNLVGVGPLSGSGTVYLGGNNLVVNSLSASTFSGGISGSGVLIKTGSQTLTLSNQNSYSGGTAISEGTLAISGSGGFNSSSGVFSIASGATLDISRASAAFGFVPVANLTGAGTVSIGENNLFVNSTDSSTFSGLIQGSGALFKGGSGTLTLTGIATYSNATFITEGTLSLSGNFTLNPQSSMALSTSGAALDISTITTSVAVGNLIGVAGTNIYLGNKNLLAGGSGNTEFAGVISGAGHFTKTGSGRLSLTGANTIGLTSVASGILSVNGSLTTGSVSVEKGGALGGTGTVISSQITAQNGGTISPGNSIGSQTYEGNLTFSPGSFYNVEVNPTASTFLDVTGTANLTGGTLLLTLEPAVYGRGAPYPILTASGGIGGENSFAGIQAFPGFTGSLDYTDTTVYLFLSQIFFPLTCDLNNRSLIEYINHLLLYNFDYVDVFGFLVFEDCRAITKGLNTVSPSSNTTASFGATINAFEVNRLISSHLFDSRFTRSAQGTLVKQELALLSQNSALPPLSKVAMSQKEEFQTSAWGVGFGNFMHEKATEEISAFNLMTRGYFIGYDAVIGEEGFWGLGAGYSNSSVHLSNNTNGGVQSIGAALYGTWTRGNFFYEGTLLLDYNRISNQRHIYFIDFDAVSSSSHDDWQFAPHFGFGYDFNFNWGCLEPYALFDYVWSWESPYREFNANLLNVAQRSRASSMLRSEIGFTAYQDWKTSLGMITLMETAAYVNRAPLQKGILVANFFGQGGSFEVAAFNRMENLFAPSFELYFKTNADFYTVFTYEGEFGSESRSNEIRVTFGKYF